MKKYDIYYCDLAGIRGSEQGGTRPCIIVQNDTGNLHAPTTIIIPLTTKHTKHLLPTHININTGVPAPSVALCEQIRTIDKSRVKNKVGCVPKEIQMKLDDAIRISMGL